MVGKGRTTQALDLENITVAKSARITAAFTVSEMSEEEAKNEEGRVSAYITGVGSAIVGGGGGASEALT